MAEAEGRGEGEGEAGEDGKGGQLARKAKAPLAPATPTGEYLSYVLTEEPHLFADAVESQLQQMQDALESEAGDGEKAGADDKETAELVLYQRISNVKALERRRSLEDLIYMCIRQQFNLIGVPMVPKLENPVELPSVGDLSKLVQGVHSAEAVELVKEHLNTALGGGAPPAAYANAMIRISKLQAAQVYAASVMFGYFLRRVDKRFQLDRALGMLPESREEVVNRLERLFNVTDVKASMDGDEVDSEIDLSLETGEAVISEAPKPAGDDDDAAGSDGPSPLRRYVESFDESTLASTARIVSAEGVSVVERHTTALFGDIASLQRQMQEAVGDAQNPRDLVEKLESAVADGRVGASPSHMASSAASCLRRLRLAASSGIRSRASTPTTRAC